MVAQLLRFPQGFLQLLLDKDINLIQIFQEGFIQIFLNILYVVEQSLQEPIESYGASQDATDAEVLTRRIEIAGVKVFHFEHRMDLEKSYLHNLLVGQLLLNIKEVVQQLADVSHCVRQRENPLCDLTALASFAGLNTHEQLRSFEDVLVVFGLVKDREGFIVVFDVPVGLSIHSNSN